MSVPIILFDKTAPVVVGKKWADSPDYASYRGKVDSVTKFVELLELLERASGDRSIRSSAAVDFAPSAAYARRFLNTTALYACKPVGSVEHTLAKRAEQAFTRLLFGGRHAGRPRQPVVSPDMHEHIMRIAKHWEAVLRPIWIAAGDEKWQVGQALPSAVGPHLLWSASHRKALRAMLARKGVRPTAVVDQLTAWTLNLSVRQVRHARRSAADEMIHA
jgi:hypothetical protein